MDNNIYLTFDMDWASDFVLSYFYKLIKDLSLVGTIHATHKTQMIDEFRKDNILELGIHPNYNKLLTNDTAEDDPKNINAILQFYKEIVPEAKCVRSHALTNSSIISSLYDDYDLKYDMNIFIPPQEGMVIKPFKATTGNHIVLPFIFEDDIWANGYFEKEAPDYFLSDNFSARRIFNFHPIHLFLNTDNMQRYQEAKEHLHDEDNLIKCVNKDNYGVKDFFVDLVLAASDKGMLCKKISDEKWIL